MKLLYFLFAGMLLLCSGCGIYNRYERPELPAIPPSYRQIDSADTTNMSHIPWREFFKDTCLQELISLGIARNADLEIARLKIESAEASLLNARLSYLPSLSLNGGASVKKADHTVSKGVSAEVGASWDVDLFGTVTNEKRGALAALKGSREYEKGVRTQLIATIATGYYNLLMLDKQLDINERTLVNWERTVKIQKALKEAGQATDLAVLQSSSNVLTLRATLLSTRKYIADTENALSVFLGEFPTVIKRGKMEDGSFPEQLLAGIPLQLLANRPDVRQYEYQLAQAFYLTNRARSNFYPSITLGGTLGWSSNGSSILNPGGWLLNALGSLTQPLFNKGSNLANLRIAQSQQEQALVHFQQSLLQASKEVNDALAQWQLAKDRLTIDEQQVSILRDAVRKSNLLLQYSSSITYLEVITAQQSLLTAEQTQLQDEYSRIQGIINLYHALGGGE